MLGRRGLDPRPWHWFFEHVCKRRVPIINISGGTEVGGCIFTGTVHHPLKPGSFAAPGLAMGADIVDDAGRTVPPGRSASWSCACRASA